mmetsp:Transcript_1462/g.5755  ORF Transcript_1462/g.5755 Transcript_1462/m.5755 type:complete len:249 (-) Transcript_1462:1633-2379(-)
MYNLLLWRQGCHQELLRVHQPQRNCRCVRAAYRQSDAVRCDCSHRGFARPAARRARRAVVPPGAGGHRRHVLPHARKLRRPRRPVQLARLLCIHPLDRCGGAHFRHGGLDGMLPPRGAGTHLPVLLSRRRIVGGSVRRPPLQRRRLLQNPCGVRHVVAADEGRPHRRLRRRLHADLRFRAPGGPPPGQSRLWGPASHRLWAAVRVRGARKRAERNQVHVGNGDVHNVRPPGLPRGDNLHAWPRWVRGT